MLATRCAVETFAGISALALRYLHLRRGHRHLEARHLLWAEAKRCCAVVKSIEGDSFRSSNSSAASGYSSTLSSQ